MVVLLHILFERIVFFGIIAIFVRDECKVILYGRAACYTIYKVMLCVA